MAIVTAEKRKITCYESDYAGKMLPTTAMNYFQEVSTNQGDALGIGSDFLKQNSLAWFLVKYVIRFRRYPRYKDEVIATTQATGMDKFCAIRRFTINDGEDREMVVADTQWMLINREDEKMARISEHPEFDVYGCHDKGEPVFKKIAKIKKVDFAKTFQVRFLDIDFNKHVNHVKYLAWAIEVLPLEVAESMDLTEAKIVYKAQCFYGDTIEALCEKLSESLYRVDIVNQENTLLCQLELNLA
jgi:medium-chain acyl-[acyl-carrier-protein] hydrolase